MSALASENAKDDWLSHLLARYRLGASVLEDGGPLRVALDRGRYSLSTLCPRCHSPKRRTADTRSPAAYAQVGEGVRSRWSCDRCSGCAVSGAVRG